MCGIGGIRRFGKDPILKDQVDLLMVGLQSRGIDASGIALQNGGGKLHLLKNDIPAWQFVTSKPYETFLKEHLTDETNIVILHTRMATKGSPVKQNNNHPMFHNKTAVVHNGVITNDDNLFRELNLPRYAETDSDILRAILDKEGLSKAGIRRLSRCMGSVACAAISPEQPDYLLLVRSGSPLICAAYNDLLIWASEKSIIHKAMRPWVDKFGLQFQTQRPDISFLTMRDNTAWLFGPSGLEWHEECKTSMYYREPERLVFGNYVERKKRWESEDDREIISSSSIITCDTKPQKLKPIHYKKASGVQIRIECESCKSLNKLTPEQYTVLPSNLLCGSCDKPLAVKK